MSMKAVFHAGHARVLHQTESRQHPLGQLPTANGPTLGTNDFRSTAQTAQTWEVLAKWCCPKEAMMKIVQSISPYLSAHYAVLRLTSQGSLCMVPFKWLDLLKGGTNEQPLLRTLQHTGFLENLGPVSNISFLPLKYPYPYRVGRAGRDKTNLSNSIFFLLGNPGIVIQPFEWNCNVAFLNKPLALVRKYLRLAPEELSASMITAAQFFWRDAIPTHVLLQSDMCFAPPELSASIQFFTCLPMTWNDEEHWSLRKHDFKNGILKWNFSTTPPLKFPFLRG